MKFRLFAMLAVAVGLLSHPAAAQLEICNKTPAPLSLAVAYETDADVVSQGWWTVDPDKCQIVVNGELNRQYYYHYAVSRPLNVEWTGTYNFCVNDDPQFRITGASDCEQRRFRTQGFRQVDVGTSKHFVLDISMGPQPAPVAPAPDPAPAPASDPAVAPAPAPAVPASPTPAAQ